LELKGEDPVLYEYKPSCVGLCYLYKLREIQVATAAAAKPRKPCVGLCYLEKLGKIEADEEVEVEAEEDYEDEEDYLGFPY
jgi:hypothetical protein